MNWKMHRMKDGLVEIADEQGGLIGYLEQPKRARTAAENETNARIITAAPEMFAACQEALDVIDSLYDGAPDSPTRGLGMALEKLNAAVRKAGAVG